MVLENFDVGIYAVIMDELFSKKPNNLRKKVFSARNT